MHARPLMLSVALVACGDGGSTTRSSSADAAAATDADRAPNLPGERCVSERFTPVPIPLELAFIVDRWVDAISWRGGNDLSGQAVTSFADASGLTQLSISLQTMPRPGASERCDSSFYAEPLVPMMTAPMVAAPLKAALASVGVQQPGALRPVYEATLSYLRARERGEESVQRAIVVLSYGLQSYCGSDVDSIAPLLRQAFQVAPSIATYFVDLSGMTMRLLQPLAIAGGSERILSLADGPDAIASLVELLDDVRADAQACSFALPVSKQGDLVPASVQLSFRADLGTTPTTWPLREAVSSCAGGLQGFYYGGTRSAPTIELCPVSCALARSARASTLSIEAACVMTVY